MRTITTKMLPVQLRGAFPSAHTGHQEDEMHITSADGMSSKDSAKETDGERLMVGKVLAPWLLGGIKAIVVRISQNITNHGRASICA